MNLEQRVPLLRWSVSRLAFGARNITTTGQIGDGRDTVEHTAFVEYQSLLPDLVHESTYLG